MSVMDAWLRCKPIRRDPRADRIHALNGTMSQREAATAMGINQATLSKWCKEYGIQWKNWRSIKNGKAA